MPYSNRSRVEFEGQINENSFTAMPTDWNYGTSIEYLIATADGEIDEYCRVPRGFFSEGGATVQNEFHNGKHLPAGSRPLLTPKHTPVLSVSKLEYYENGAWATLAEGIDNDYIVAPEGAYLIDTPNRTTYQNIRISYRAGYPLTPQNVATVSARLAAATAHLIIDARNRAPMSVAGAAFQPPEIATLTKAAFTPPLKDMLLRYRLDQVKVTRG